MSNDSEGPSNIPGFDEFFHSHAPVTSVTHRDVYPAINPTRPELQAALSGKTVIITGAGRGIGRGTAVSFAKAGPKNLVIVARSEDQLQETRAEVAKANKSVNVIAETLDISSEGGVESFYGSLQRKLGPDTSIDVLVNNAGVSNGGGKKIGELALNEFWSNHEVNVKGTFLVTQGLIKFNPPDYPATVIHTLSSSVNETTATVSGYNSSKVSEGILAQHLHAEYPNLRVFSFAPGLVRTDATWPFLYPFAKDTAELSGSVCVWFSSPEADFLRGKFITVHWDVNELEQKLGDKLKQTELLTFGVRGWDVKYPQPGQ